MASLKFNHVFVALVSASAASAVFLPASVAEYLRAPVVLLFSPVSSPVHAGSAWLGDRINPPSRQIDANVPTDIAALQDQNAQLRADVASLTAQLDVLKRLNDDRSQLGVVRERSVPATVVGLDGGTAGVRQVLAVSVAADVGVAEGQAAVSPRGLVGRVIASVRGGTRVRLTTDADFRVQGAFVRFTPNSAGGVTPQLLPGEPPLVTGTGTTTPTGLRIGNLSLLQTQQSGVLPGDWVVLDDKQDWPELLQGYKIGRVMAVEKSRLNPLWAEITVEPPADFRRLREVMIVNRP